MFKAIAFAICVMIVATAVRGQTHVSIAEPPVRGDMVSHRPADASQSVQAAEPVVLARVAKIKAELLQLSGKAEFKAGEWAKDWAGQYVSGETGYLSTELYIAPDGGVACITHTRPRGDLVGVDEADIAEVHDDGLSIRPKFDAAENAFLSTRIYFVEWGGRRFLVPDWQMAEFANEYNTSPSNRRSMLPILRKKSPAEGDMDFQLAIKPPEGKPKVPAEFESWFHETPLWLRVMKFGPMKTEGHTGAMGCGLQTAELQFDAGSDRGIYVGMKIIYPLLSTLSDPQTAFMKNRLTTIVVTSVDAKSSKGLYSGNLDAGPRPQSPHQGERIKTGMDEADERTMFKRMGLGNVYIK